jgi:hypothetical protein
VTSAQKDQPDKEPGEQPIRYQQSQNANKQPSTYMLSAVSIGGRFMGASQALSARLRCDVIPNKAYCHEQTCSTLTRCLLSFGGKLSRAKFNEKRFRRARQVYRGGGGDVRPLPYAARREARTRAHVLVNGRAYSEATDVF